jgi:signal transduction histidine kinase
MDWKIFVDLDFICRFEFWFMRDILIIIIAGLFSAVGLFLYWKSRQLKIDLSKREADMHRKMYELAILKELGDRIGYSLNIQNIIDIILGSLSQFIDYKVVSYMLLEPEKVVFKVHLEQSVSREFIDNIRDRMLKSLSALLDKELKKGQIKESLSGAILIDELKDPVQSFFNIPLAIGERVVGILTVAHTAPGLYKEEEMTILYKIVKQASSAITRLQDVVQTEQRKLNAMVESMIEGVVMTDKDYRIMVANPAAKAVVGLEDKEELSIFDFIDRLEGKFDIRGKLEESVKLDKILTIDEVLIHDHFFQIFVAPVKSSTGMTKGEILGGVVIFHDITHEKEVEKMREDFTSMMVHELRSPLDGIKKLTEIMGEDAIRKSKPKHNKYVQMIHQSSSDMLELVNELLDVAKLESGKFEIYTQPSDIKEIITSRINFYQTSAKNEKIKLAVSLDKSLPAKADFDQVKIAQVLNNLISNALKFTQTGGQVTVQALVHHAGQDIDVEASQAKIEWLLHGKEEKLANLPDSIIIAVTDTGIGISSEQISQLFNKFKQLGNQAKSGIKGTGLGLVIAKGIVEAHKGLIGVASEEGVGSTFYFTLPLATN